MSNKIFTRLLDLVLLGALVSGNHDARIFAYVVISFMSALMILGLFAIDVAMAEKLREQSLIGKITAAAVHALYVAALIYSGFPILAAVYACLALGIRCAAEAKLKPKVSS